MSVYNICLYISTYTYKKPPTGGTPRSGSSIWPPGFRKHPGGGSREGGGGSRVATLRHVQIYDIGTEILLLTKNDHNSTQKAPKSIIPQEIKSAGHSPSSGSVKSRFKALFKK